MKNNVEREISWLAGPGEVMIDKSNAVVAILFTNWLGSQQYEIVQLSETKYINQSQLEKWSIPYNFDFNNLTKINLEIMIFDRNHIRGNTYNNFTFTNTTRIKFYLNKFPP